jgi:signal transduction histidine kinase
VYGSVSLLWPPTGVALAVILLLGSQYWPGIFLGAVLANALTNGPLPFAILAGIGNTLEALIGAYLLTRFCDFHARLDRLRDVVALVGLGAGISTLVSATVGVLGLCLNGMTPWQEFGSTWTVWWLGDAIGDLIIAPVLLTWGTQFRLTYNPRQLIEVGLWLIATGLASGLAFSVHMSGTPTDFSLVYLSFPLLMWAALRFGVRGSSAATLIVSFSAVWGIIHGLGLFASTSVNAPLLFLWVFMGTAAVATLFLAAVVTERKNAEAQVRSLNADLEVRVRQRTAQLEEAIQERDEFLSIAAHELKTPVTSLHGFTEISLRRMNKEETPLSEDIRHTLEVIDQQALKLTRFVAQLLDISRLQSGKLVLERETTNVTRLVEEIVTMLQVTTTEHNIVLHAASFVTALVDPLRLEQVIVNLLTNAIRFSPTGSTITLELSALDPEYLQIICTDNGIGISPEDRDHIFDRGYSGQHSGGMGLGLYISKEIIDLHGGQLTAEFPETGGTRFIIFLPYGSLYQGSGSSQVSMSNPVI